MRVSYIPRLLVLVGDSLSLKEEHRKPLVIISFLGQRSKTWEAKPLGQSSQKGRETCPGCI